LQTCIVHLTRNCLDYASYEDRKALGAALRRSTKKRILLI
jgi:transposase-like protein